MNFQQRIEKAIGVKDSDNGIKVFHEACAILVSEFHWDYEAIVNSPIPFVLGVIDEYGKLKQKEQSKIKKRRR